ncbi:uncharacterized protein LOC113287651 [Papaver somniferum]|uniref:uncharacterized protein LOC113287651 n=1 Tax=Papaver somniferum TaxID=3469 RepID=UPI000E702D4E|nr:uncharacterized protein LOC113287651 [Papaver somniferum]XP_026392242.1 uncharacterized protein LOC113287651 [Papaver somniferum]XP_026392243.1 uncharacterized protein LOC113287651 [Papaver somniferum]
MKMMVLNFQYSEPKYNVRLSKPERRCILLSSPSRRSIHELLNWTKDEKPEGACECVKIKRTPRLHLQNLLQEHKTNFAMRLLQFSIHCDSYKDFHIGLLLIINNQHFAWLQERQGESIETASRKTIWRNESSFKKKITCLLIPTRE